MQIESDSCIEWNSYSNRIRFKSDSFYEQQPSSSPSTVESGSSRHKLETLCAKSALNDGPQRPPAWFCRTSKSGNFVQSWGPGSATFLQNLCRFAP